MSTITVTIGGVDKTTALLAESLYIRLGINNQGTVCQFTISGAGGYVPAAWDEVTVTVDSVAVFGGYITSRDAARAGVGTSARLHWSVECRDYSALFDRLIVTAQYKSSTDKSIIGQLFTTYLSGEGFDASTNVPALAYNVSIGFQRQTLRAALNTLAKQFNCAWFVDSSKNLYWFKTFDPPAAAFDIDTESPNNSTTFDVMDIRRRIDDTARVNRITVIGGGIRAAEVTTESFASDGSVDTFGPLAQTPHTVVRVRLPTAQIPARLIGMEPDAALYYDTGTPPNIQALFNRESRTFRIRDLLGNPPLAGTVYVTYYPVTALTVTVDDTDAQAAIGRVFEQEVYRPDITNPTAAENYGLTMLERLANERETLAFDIARPGLMPGTMIDVTSSGMDVDVPEYNYLLLENGDNWLLEDGRAFILESSVIAGRYLIQDVTYRPVTTGVNQFLVIASVTSGEYQRSLLDTLAQTVGNSGAGALPAPQFRNSLSDVSANMGEIVAGRAVFTDGGAGAFSWEDYNGHTGAVIGLEGTAEQRGAAYILEGGTVRAKLGNLDGLPTLGTIVPSGWGLWTNNGYFQGTVVSSQLIGATVSTSDIVDSSNPGVIFDADGIRGYGSVGLVFSLPSNPALKPWFSSGTILNTVYEINESAVLRTGTTNPRVQIDNSGIYAYNSGGTVVTKIETSTGRLTATSGVFSGSVTASTISGGTVTGAVFTGGTVTQGTISASRITGGTVTGNTITGNTITGGTVSGALVTGGTVSVASNSVQLTDDDGLSISVGTAIQNAVTWRRTGMSYPFAQIRGDPASGNHELLIQVRSENGSVPFLHLSNTRSSLQLVDYNAVLRSDGTRNAVITATGQGNGTITIVPRDDDNNQGFVFIGGNVELLGNVLYPETSSAAQLGMAGQSFRYLYMNDGVGNHYRFTINSSGDWVKVAV